MSLTSYENYIPDVNVEDYTPDIPLGSFDNLFTLNHLFNFWPIPVIIIVGVIWKNTIGKNFFNYEKK